MKSKKITIIALAATLLVGVAALAALSRNDTVRQTRSQFRKLLRGTLTTEQLKTLKDFRISHRDEREARLADRPDPSELWFELALTEDQQDKLLEVADQHAEELAQAFAKVRARAVELRQEVMDGGPDSSKLEPLSLALGDELGDAAVMVSRVAGEARSVLTPRQLEVLARHRADHDARLEAELDRLPHQAEDLAKLWNDLALTPDQVDALSEVRDLGRSLRHERHHDGREEFRGELADVLDGRQLDLLDQFHDERQAERGPMREERRSAREKLEQQLNLTGEQKIALVNLATAQRENLVNTARLLAASGMDLVDAVLAPRPDEQTIRADAGNFGRLVGLSSIFAAQMIDDARKILDQNQFDLIRTALDDHDRMADRRLAEAPQRVHGLIDLLNQLDLAPEQKNQIMVLVGNKHDERMEHLKRRPDEL